jgi:hypothetical protein
MGCDTYYFNEIPIRFSETDDGGCLCTFPFNDCGKLTNDRVKLLALLGAAVVLIHCEEIEESVYLPYSIPSWIVEEINRILNI